MGLTHGVSRVSSSKSELMCVFSFFFPPARQELGVQVAFVLIIGL